MSPDTLYALLAEGIARVPTTWELDAATATGLWWRAEPSIAVATPTLLRLASALPRLAEGAALPVAVEPRYREPWLRLEAARLVDLGHRGAEPELIAAIEALGPAAGRLRELLGEARVAPTGFAELEVELFGAPADQPAAGPPLQRVLAATAPLVEGRLGAALAPLSPVVREHPAAAWCRERLLQAPGGEPLRNGRWVLGGNLPARDGDLVEWVTATAWATLLGQLVFMAEAWSAERRGGLSLELPEAHLGSFASPPRVDVVVTLADGHEVLCGSVGGLVLRALEALDMALVPALDAGELDQRLGPVVGRLLTEGVWSYRAEARPGYEIGRVFSDACYRGEGHRLVYRAGEPLTQVLRSTAVAWARALVEPAREGGDS